MIQRMITAVRTFTDSAVPPVIPVMCPKKSRVPHVENTALKVSLNRQI